MVKVLYILGGTRSGSTILDTLLGELDGFFSTGELRRLWERGLLEGGVCGCGRAFLRCEVWSAVLAWKGEGGGGPGGVDPRQVVRWQRGSLRVRHTWGILRSRTVLAGTPSQDASSLASYARVANDLYRAVADVTGSRVVVDSSKLPSDAALLGSLPDVSPYFVHVVRDPRAVAHSWQRVKVDRKDGATTEMARWSPAKSTANWIGVNLAADAVRRAHRSRSMLLRYEDFVRDPKLGLERIAAMVGETGVALPFIDGRTASVGGNHTVSGNPNRFEVGTVEVRADDAWLTEQGKAQQGFVSALASPFLGRYGYSLIPRPPRRAPAPVD